MRRFFYCTVFCLFFVPALGISALSDNNENLKENNKIYINNNYYFVYSFTAKPKIGSSVLKIIVYNEVNKKNDKLEITGSYDMPQMRGHHPSGAISLKKNKNNDYLMPLNLVMRGYWEIVLIFKEDGKEIYSGTININI